MSLTYLTGVIRFAVVLTAWLIFSQSTANAALSTECKAIFSAQSKVETQLQVGGELIGLGDVAWFFSKPLLRYEKLYQKFSTAVGQVDPATSYALQNYALAGHFSINEFMRNENPDFDRFTPADPARVDFASMSGEQWRSLKAAGQSYKLARLLAVSPKVPLGTQLYRGIAVLPQNLPQPKPSRCFDGKDRRIRALTSSRNEVKDIR